MNAAIQISNLTKRYGKQVALDGVSFDVPEGSVFALLGENGAGKTTAIRIMLGLMQADDGAASLVGLDSARDGEAIRRRIGYVPEQPDLYDWMTVQEIGWFAAGFHGEAFWPGYQQCIDRFKVTPAKKIKSLSKGMRAKVSLSLALAHNPDLLILDEPTSGLDAIVRREFLESMVDRAAEGKTVFLSSHQINEVERVADYVAIIRQGDLLTAEPLDQLKEDTSYLRIALADDTSPLPTLPGKVLELREMGRQVDVILRGADRASIERLRDDPTVRAVEVETPNLEEIFVAYMTGNGGVSSTAATDKNEPPTVGDSE